VATSVHASPSLRRHGRSRATSPSPRPPSASIQRNRRKARRSRPAAVRAQADLLDSYGELIREVNALHANLAFETGVELDSRALTTLGRLFGPMGAPLEEIDPLTSIAEPTRENVARWRALLAIHGRLATSSVAWRGPVGFGRSQTTRCCSRRIRAPERSSPDSPGSPSELPRCAAAPARSSTATGPANRRSPAPAATRARSRSSHAP
jgi:hypothetical protein